MVFSFLCLLSRTTMPTVIYFLVYVCLKVESRDKNERSLDVDHANPGIELSTLITNCCVCVCLFFSFPCRIKDMFQLPDRVKRMAAIPVWYLLPFCALLFLSFSFYFFFFCSSTAGIIREVKSRRWRYLTNTLCDLFSKETIGKKMISMFLCR